MDSSPQASADEWILVAGATAASLFRRGGDGRLEPLQTFHEARERIPVVRGGAVRRMLGEPSPQRRRQLRFAADLAAHLERGVSEGRCGRIALLAACPFLGALRKSLPPKVRQAVSTTLSADLCDASDQRILDALAGAPGRD
jgi:protein required for attachment to host cells